jgi:hypothetical protein
VWSAEKRAEGLKYMQLKPSSHSGRVVRNPELRACNSIGEKSRLHSLTGTGRKSGRAGVGTGGDHDATFRYSSEMKNEIGFYPRDFTAIQTSIFFLAKSPATIYHIIRKPDQTNANRRGRKP